MTRLALLAAKRPELFHNGTGIPMVSEADAELIHETVRNSSVDRIFERIHNSRPSTGPGHRAHRFRAIAFERS
jgi:hypothetical protein